MSDILETVTAIIQAAPLSDGARRALLSDIVAQNWGALPPWSTLDRPKINTVETATVGSGIAVVFQEDGVRKILLAEAGEHYGKGAGALMIAGGFINLTRTEGSTLVPASNKPESARIGGVRELEEEMPRADGSPLLVVNPQRLKPMDTDTLAFPNGDKRIVIGLMLEIVGDEITLVKEHVARLASDPAYRTAVAAHTANLVSKKPEATTLVIRDLSDAAAGTCNLLHADQLSLFRAIEEHFKTAAAVTKRTTPTRAYLEKVKSLDDLAVLVDEWRKQGDSVVGITSGAFDIVHPGHISFLEDANQACSRLIAIVASDRTICEQKGADRPYIPAEKRAQTIAALGTVDAVIISDELYHETILKALKPEVMFKGDDYKGKPIIGADLVGSIVLIPCAEKDYYSSSEFIRKIRSKGADSLSPG